MLNRQTVYQSRASETNDLTPISIDENVLDFNCPGYGEWKYDFSVNGEIKKAVESLASIYSLVPLKNEHIYLLDAKSAKDNLGYSVYGKYGLTKQCNSDNRDYLYIKFIWDNLKTAYHLDDWKESYSSTANVYFGHEFGHVLTRTRNTSGKGFIFSPLYSAFKTQIAMWTKKEIAPSVYSQTLGVEEDFADSITLFVNAHDSFCEKRQLRCKFITCALSATNRQDYTPCIVK